MSEGQQPATETPAQNGASVDAILKTEAMGKAKEVFAAHAARYPTETKAPGEAAESKGTPAASGDTAGAPDNPPAPPAGQEKTTPSGEPQDDPRFARNFALLAKGRRELEQGKAEVEKLRQEHAREIEAAKELRAQVERIRARLAEDPEDALEEAAALLGAGDEWKYDKRTIRRLKGKVPPEVAAIQKRLDEQEATRKREADEAAAKARAAEEADRQKIEQTTAQHLEASRAYVTQNADDYPMLAAMGGGAKVHEMIVAHWHATEGRELLTFEAAATKLEETLTAAYQKKAARQPAAKAVSSDNRAPDQRSGAEATGDGPPTLSARHASVASPKEPERELSADESKERMVRRLTEIRARKLAAQS